MFLENIAYFENEIAKECDFREWIKGKPTLNIISYEDYLSLESAPNNTLFVVTKEEGASIAKRAGAAVVAYNPNEYVRTQYVIEGFEEVDDEYLERIYSRFMGKPWDILETKRCYIREFELSDIDSLFELYSKSGITDYVEPLYEYEKELEYQRDYIRHMYGYFGYGMWLVFHKETGKLIGRAGLENRDYGPDTELEMGYIIAPEYQRQGYATEVCKAIIDFARNETYFKRINCLIDEANTASINFIKSMGFAFLEKSMASGKVNDRYVFKLKR